MANTNPNLPFLIKFNTDLLVGAIVRKGGADKVQANAKAVIAVANALQTVNGGDVQGGLVALDQALGGAGDAATQAEIQTVIAWLASKAVAIQQVLAGTLLGAEVATLVGQVLNETLAVANSYLPKGS